MKIHLNYSTRSRQSRLAIRFVFKIKIAYKTTTEENYILTRETSLGAECHLAHQIAR